MATGYSQAAAKIEVQTVEMLDLAYMVYLEFSSSFHGIEICAPFRETVLDEATMLLRTAVEISNFSAREEASTTSTAYMPMKVSPAAVVSTTATFRAGTNPLRPSLQM
jgi:hypothetical protein